ncbi:histidinol-phosphatase HisJ family protein [Paenibacillus sinopodophylli]|uniref:histidinol-phosphatase HisJ family protein n=1 Tax=Paenibacillus sinopodophylli TaxID=1837342 RepID=UPI00110CF872|nr:histidinol-phosphatase HisJ family protein [Paenibacillus sinopodophylli]
MTIPHLLIDQHVHSSYSPDSSSSLEELVRFAVALGKPALVTTDHLEYDCKYFKQDVHIDWAGYNKEVEELSQRYPIEIRKGIEVGFRSDYKVVIDDYLAQHEFDVILLSAHNDGRLDFSEKAFHDKPIQQRLMHYFNHVRDAVDQMDNYDIVAHLDYVVRYTTFPVYDEDIASCRSVLYDIVKLIIEKQKVLELNTTGLYRQGWIHPHSYILDMYLDLGGRAVCIGSDAHQVGHMEQGFVEAIELLHSKGIREVVQFKGRTPYSVSI